jgi:hypothetical protein
LVIASDIRQLEHIEYTPAPDIIHEGAGHAQLSQILNTQNIFAVLVEIGQLFRLARIMRCMKPYDYFYSERSRRNTAKPLLMLLRKQLKTCKIWENCLRCTDT